MTLSLTWQWVLAVFLTALAAGLGWSLGCRIVGRLK